VVLQRRRRRVCGHGEARPEAEAARTEETGGRQGRRL
jgi:hypothetical protein